MRKIKLLLTLILLFFIPNLAVKANIDFSVTPTKYEIEALKWTTITRTAKIYNYSKVPHTITIWKSDFTTSWNTWVPKIVRRSELVYPDQQLSSWLEIWTGSFIVEPWKSKEIDFKINVPENATPGGHYWVVFFKKTSRESSDAEIWVNLDYWVLVILNVDWEIVMKGLPEDMEIIMDKWVGNLKEDECFYDFTSSNFDWKCFIFPFGKQEDLTSAPDEDKKDFYTYFNLPFKNEWNTHIKPIWTITLIDSNWDQLKWIWREIIKNSRWAIVWERIVDYIPINDVWGNVLPYSTRDFELTWQWFSYKTYDEEWNEIIKYWTPWEYYTKQNVENRWFIMFWEKVMKRVKYEKITAIIDISYKDREWKNVEFNSAEEFDISYKEDYIWLNMFVIIPMVLIAILVFTVYLIIFLRKKKCEKCEKRIWRHLKACPYCWKKVKSNDKDKKSKNKKKKK